MPGFTQKQNKNPFANLPFHNIFSFLSVAVIALSLPVLIFLNQKKTNTQIHASSSIIFPYVQGNQIIDEQGNPLILRGTQVPSEFNVHYQTGATIPTTFTPQLFTSMQSWKMNVVRIPVAAYYYNLPNYMTLLDGVISQANNAGLYVVLGNFEDSRSGGTGVLDNQGMQFWSYMAVHYANNPKVIFDLINEPQTTSWSDWLNGNGSTIVGMQQAVNAIRTAGGKQLIIAQAPDVGITGFSGFTSFINDPNIVYSSHMYFKAPSIRTSTGWDSAFGNLSQSYPFYIGEFAFLPNANYPSFCNNLNAASGTALIQNFLSYMEQHQISWSAWAFNQYHLVQETVNYTPTFLKSPDEDICCGLGPSKSCNFGMGTLIQNYLATATQPPTFTPTPTPTPTPSPTPSPTPTPTPTFTPTPTTSYTTQKVSFDNSTNASDGSGCAATSISWSHWIGNNKNNLLLIGTRTLMPVSSVTFGSYALAKIAALDCSGGQTNCHDELWYMANPPAGGAKITITIPKKSCIAGGAVSYYNVNQSIPLGSIAVTNGTTAKNGSASITLSTNTSQLVFDSFVSSQKIKSDNSQIQRLQINNEPFGASEKPAGISATTMTWGTSFANWAEIAVPINPSQ